MASVPFNHVSFAVRMARPRPVDARGDAAHETVAHDWKVEDRVRLNAAFNRTREGTIKDVCPDGFLCVHWDVEGPTAVHPSLLVRI